MKPICRFTAILLALILMTALTTTVFAAGSGSITVENPKEGETYTAYLIFDVVYNTEKSAYSYTIAADSQWLSTVRGYAGVTLSDVVTDGDGNSFYIVTKNDDFSAAEFAKTLQGAMDGKTGTALTISDSKATAIGLELGYYFVSSTNGALCNLTTINPNATIYDKNDVPFEKTADDVSVEVGQTVHFSIEGKVPDTTGFGTYIYEISDTMTSGLTFGKDVQVYVDGALLTDTIDIAIAGSDADDTTLTVEADVANSTGSQLPSTGGIGTTVFYTVGAIMMAVSAILLITKKRMSTSE